MAGTESLVVVEVFSGEGVVGLEVVLLTWELSLGLMLMVLEGDVFRVGEVVVGWEILLGVALAGAVGVFGTR